MKNAIKFLHDSKIPDGSKGDMCRAVRNDADFGRLFLAGPNPGMLRRCHALPAHFPVTQDTVEGLIDRSGDLATEIKVRYATATVATRS